jgi:hypothetical protein
MQDASAWETVGRGPTATAFVRHEYGPDGESLWRARYVVRYDDANRRWHGAGPLPLGARWPGDTRDLESIARIVVREAIVAGFDGRRPTLDRIVHVLGGDGLDEDDAAPSVSTR